MLATVIALQSIIDTTCLAYYSSPNKSWSIWRLSPLQRILCCHFRDIKYALFNAKWTML